MAELTAFDKALCDSDRLLLRIRRPTDAGGGASEAHKVQFQFPPKIINDSRSSDWKEDGGGPNAGDKIAVFQHADPRRITIEWSYIVGFNNWSVADIKDELKTLRGYFRNPFIEGSGPTAMSPLVIEVLLWDVGGDAPMSFRMREASIKHRPTIVRDDEGQIFHLFTDISIELKSWPLIGTPPVQTVPGQVVFGSDWF